MCELTRLNLRVGVYIFTSSRNRYVISRVKSFLNADPNATVISVTQNDGGGEGICHTPDEDAVTKEEGSPSGPLLRAVNAVADAIVDEYVWPHHRL